LQADQWDSSKMENLNRYISSLKQDLNQVLFGLNGVNDYNFDEKMEFVNQRLLSIQKMKEEMQKHYDKAELEKFNPELDFIIKEINVKFDNMVEERTQIKDRIGKEIKSKQNEKKLVNYKR